MQVQCHFKDAKFILLVFIEKHIKGPRQLQPHKSPNMQSLAICPFYEWIQQAVLGFHLPHRLEWLSAKAPPRHAFMQGPFHLDGGEKSTAGIRRARNGGRSAGPPPGGRLSYANLRCRFREFTGLSP